MPPSCCCEQIAEELAVEPPKQAAVSSSALHTDTVAEQQVEEMLAMAKGNRQQPVFCGARFDVPRRYRSGDEQAVLCALADHGASQLVHEAARNGLRVSLDLN